VSRTERIAWTLAAIIMLAMVARGAVSIIHDGWMPDWLWNPWRAE
jgi:hypothetical protein